MSQVDEETAKYKLNENQYNCNHYGQMRQTENNQQVMPLYENCTINNNQNPDHLLLESSPTKSESFNYNCNFALNTTNAAHINGREVLDINCVNPSDYEYENINFGGKEKLDKRILLQKYFRSALVGPRSNIYENLCRGCNYGVFNARGPLCTFCECIVNGVSALRSNTPETSLTISNIYENICEYCGVIYSETNCTECKCSQTEPVKSEEGSVIENENVLECDSEELLTEKSEKQKKKVNIKKSKSFNKSNKPKIFTNLWDTLRKPKTTASSNTSNNVNKKPLEIIHHVDGYERVFHTKDTFDLKEICELKRSATSCSDQHIYGRLKQNDFNSSQEQFNSTQSLAQSSKSLTILIGGKKPRISKTKFLRTQTSATSIDAEPIALYLNNSVCHWMTSLRRETHTYNTLNECNQETLCYPKSIPSRNVLNSCKAPILLTNHTNTVQNLTLAHENPNYADLTEVLLVLSTHNTLASGNSWEIQQQPDCYQLKVEEFIANVINRQMLHTNDSRQQIDNVRTTVAGVKNNDGSADIYNNNSNNSSIDSMMDIPLRQTSLTPTTTTANNQNHNNNNNNRHKRQGMYLRLEDHQRLEPHNVAEQINLHENNINSRNEIHTNNNNCTHKDVCVIQGEKRVESPCEHNNGAEYLKSLLNPHAQCNTVTTPDTLITFANEEAFASVSSSCYPNPAQTGWDLIKSEKRRGIHERNVLQAFEALLEQEQRNNQLTRTAEKHNFPESQTHKAVPVANTEENTLQQQPCSANAQTISAHLPTQVVLNVAQLINQQQLSSALNTLIICYDKYLKLFLPCIYQQTKTNTGVILYKIPNKQLVRRFQQFYNYCELNNVHERANNKCKTKETKLLPCVSSKLKLDLNATSDFERAHLLSKNYNESFGKPNDLRQGNSSASDLNKTEIRKRTKQKIKTPPQVPKRDPKTKLSPTVEIKIFVNSKMTKPVNNLKTETKPEHQIKDEESIYQPIWKFETRGKVQERYRTDDDYYDLKALKHKIQQESPNSEIPTIFISSETLPEEEEDHNNWEPDEEFVFTKQMKKQRSSSLTSERVSSLRSAHSSNSSLGTSCSLSGSTITEFASSTATLASTFSCSLRHHLFRNIGIFYSLTEPKLRAIIYDYDRIHSCRYFAKAAAPKLSAHDSGIGKSLPLKHSPASSSVTSSPTTSNTSSPVSATKMPQHSSHRYTNIINKSSSASDNCTGAKAKVPNACPPTTPPVIPNCVQAWKYQLWHVNYMEDEEDMIVSESEILRAQQIKEDIDQSPPTQPQQFMQRFKSRSTENFLELPIEDDKKTIAERLANMYTRFSPIQRGILNINGRNSPKSEKKAYKLNRASQSTSLYLEDGLKPKYPIFGAALDQLELQQNVPRFVVDAVDYIERKDRIIQDGIYRACGNKFCIDELKQKLTKSYIYDSKLIAADDVHTVTSLLKQFFRDLPEPVIPLDIYSRITTNLADKQAVDMIRIAIEEMKEPNKSTLRFLIKHLTNVAACSSSNRMNASNVAIVWGPSLFSQNDTYDMIGRMNTLTKVLIENFDRIFDTNERLL